MIGPRLGDAIINYYSKQSINNRGNRVELQSTVTVQLQIVLRYAGAPTAARVFFLFLRRCRLFRVFCSIIMIAVVLSYY